MSMYRVYSNPLFILISMYIVQGELEPSVDLCDEADAPGGGGEKEEEGG